MKTSKIIFGLICGAFIGTANAADISIFYAPTCPHCHHAREFISSTLIYEYDNLNVTEVNVTKNENKQAFVDALFKCGYQRGGVPVIVIGDVNKKDGFKCFQGYADSMQSQKLNLKKKITSLNDTTTNIVLIGLLILLLAGFVFVVFKKRK